MMIKTPVGVGIATINSMTGWCNVRTIVDVNMSPINNSNEELVEAEKRINMHDELVNALQDAKDFTDWYYTGKADGGRPKKPLNEIAKNIGELLERCK